MNHLWQSICSKNKQHYLLSRMNWMKTSNLLLASTIYLLMGMSSAMAQFSEAPQYSSNSSAGKGPSSVTAGDFAGDASGYGDMAVVDGTGTVRVFLNKRDGSGSFSTASSYQIGTNALNYVIAAGAFQSGSQVSDDLVVADNLGNVSLLLSNGNGRFQQASVVYSAAASFTSMVVGDLHDKKNNGLSDIALGDSISGLVYVLAAQGSGSFTASNYSSGVAAGQPIFLTFGAFNNSSPALNDLAAAAQDGSVTVLRNKTKSGAISFSPRF